ncbi:MAG TPA: sulfurtransferase [Balneolales bacterium]|jgi:thiosulfate/3-mercaptopyruvate sulfurtransferase|nr:sulfurtransferase [Balneolales bacterium]
MTKEKFESYAHPEMLVTTDWVANHLEDENIRIIESNEDPLLYDTGHIPNSINIDWHTELNDPVIRDYVNEHTFRKLMERKGISKDTEVIFYGDKNNWWACYALWVFRLYNHENVRIMDGGRKKWEEESRKFTKDIPEFEPGDYPMTKRDNKKERAFLLDVMHHLENGLSLIDVRSPQEFSGELLHMPEYPQEGVLRGGHIRGANNIPWSRAANEDGTFKTRVELEEIYLNDTGIDPEDEVITYCRIGERSSHTWFVLKYLLGLRKVRNYDGSWTEWGNMVRMPIERP